MAQPRCGCRAWCVFLPNWTNSERVYTELDWSIRAMAYAELLALREQIPDDRKRQPQTERAYDTKDRILANTMHALRKCMREELENLRRIPDKIAA